MKEKCKICMGIGIFECEHSPQPEDWESRFEEEKNNFLVYNSQSGSRFLDEDKIKSFIKTEIRKAEEMGYRKHREKMLKEMGLEEVKK
jgi:hypothetical protein